MSWRWMAPLALAAMIAFPTLSAREARADRDDHYYRSYRYDRDNDRWRNNWNRHWNRYYNDRIYDDRDWRYRYNRRPDYDRYDRYYYNRYYRSPYRTYRYYYSNPWWDRSGWNFDFNWDND